MLVVCWLFATPIASAEPIKTVALSGGRPSPRMFEPVHKALVALDPVLAERLVVSIAAADLATEKIEPLAIRLMAQRPDLAVALDLESALALVKARGNGSTPIIFRAHADPLGSNLIASYARPGRNLTGVTTYRCLEDKLVEILLDAFPAAHRIGFFVEPAVEDWGCHKRAQEFARNRGITLIDLKLNNDKEMPAMLESLGSRKLDAMVVPALASTWTQRKRVVAAMDSLSLPAIYEASVFTDAGGLMHFGAFNQADANAQMAQMIVKIFNGENAGEIPVNQPTGFELVINMKNPNAVRYGINPRLLRRADRIIE